MRPNIYAARGGDPAALNRRSDRRDDPAWIAARAASADARVLPYWRRRHWFDAKGDVGFVNGDRAAGLLDGGRPMAFLGEDADGAWFAVDLSADDHPEPHVGDSGAWDDLRLRGATLPWRDAARVAYARAVFEWRAKWRFCPHTGEALEPRPSGTALYPSSDREGRSYFPRIDPAV
ncbi:MAG: NUDIX-like domain-containing protein, partial [Pseudomonadota bacterium]